MIVRPKPHFILWYMSLGFSAIILLSWLNELLSLPTRLFGGTYHPNWNEALIETIVVLVVWAGVIALTRRLLRRLYYLEGFLRVCAWCRRIGHDDQWLPLEDYFQRGFHVRTTHGVCPACREKMFSET